MELKFAVLGSGNTKLFESSNRTFMELKYFLGKSLVVPIIVLIVPLWNWNSGKSYVGQTTDEF